LEIAIQELLDRKSWKPGTTGTFAHKFFSEPFAQNGRDGLDKVNESAFGRVERLYKVRNKVAHEGKTYYVDDSATPPQVITVTTRQRRLHATSCSDNIGLDRNH
jgi:hypothetical protein